MVAATSGAHPPASELLDATPLETELLLALDAMLLDASLEVELLEATLLALDDAVGGSDLVPPLLPQAVNTLMLAIKPVRKNSFDHLGSSWVCIVRPVINMSIGTMAGAALSRPCHCGC
ncbi:hypothetical protein R50076_04840 [Gilvimarinus japonicus]|jgi:hypothetical protein